MSREDIHLELVAFATLVQLGSLQLPNLRTEILFFGLGVALGGISSTVWMIWRYFIFVLKNISYMGTVLLGGRSSAISNALMRFKSFDSLRMLSDFAMRLMRCQQVELLLLSRRASAAICSSRLRSTRRSATSAGHWAYLERTAWSSST